MAATLPGGYRRIAFGEVPSTNDEARRFAEAGAAEGLVVTAEVQSAGRGRHGKVWISPAGNLHCSLLARPAIALARASELVFAAGVAACAAIAQLAPERAPRCKWPNDVLVGGRKVAGVLAEAGTGNASGHCAHVVIGVGVNVAHHPAEAAWPATSLAAEGASATAEDTLASLVAAWDEWYARWRSEGFGAIRAAWLDRAYALGETIELRQDRGARRGRFLGLDTDGALILETVAGARETHRFGDVAAPGG